MAKNSKEREVSLLQKASQSEELFVKMRDALMPAMAPGKPQTGARKREARTRRESISWWVRVGFLAVVVSAGITVITQKDRLLARFGYESVPSLPTPGAALGSDEQALYWTYALFDIGKLRSRFGVQGFYAIDQARARRNLDGLIPAVSPPVLGEISAYTPVAFRTLPAKGGK